MSFRLLFFIFLLFLASGKRFHQCYEGLSTTLKGVHAKRSQQQVGFTPTSGITLTYEHDGNSYASVDLTMKHPTIVIEHIEDVASVGRSKSSLNITFSTPAAFETGIRSWAQHSSLVFVTKHVAGRDADEERVFHVASNLHWNRTTRMLTVDAQKMDLLDIASSVRASFSSWPFKQQSNTSFTNPVEWETASLSPAGQDVSDPPFVDGRTEQGYFDTNFFYTGYLDYDIGNKRPNELYIDANLTSADVLPLILNITAPYNDTVSFLENPLSSYIYGIPGILDIQPTLQYAGGADITAASPTVARTNLTNGLVDGHIHLDLVNPDNTYISGLWDGNYNSDVVLEPVAGIRITPFLELGAMFVVNVTGIETSFVQAFKGTTKSTYVFQLTGTEDACTRTAYAYSMDAFNLEGWRRTLYNRQDPFTNSCR
ncbi:hypothetical protein SUNI508_03305 [Seiridium unicorne]|uniref:DUF7029 domain-containing protein n=1 Tax=Seiridium unicorne TaxID=138068 RepID=A0ABR2VE21_9PEZI